MSPVIFLSSCFAADNSSSNLFSSDLNFMPISAIRSARRLSENQVKPDKDLRRMADETIFEFSGKTTYCHIKKRRKLFGSRWIAGWCQQEPDQSPQQPLATGACVVHELEES